MAKQSELPRAPEQVLAGETFAATKRAMSAGQAYLPLVELIDTERARNRGAGQPPLWLQHLENERSIDLAAAILYAVIESYLFVQDQPETDPDPPLVSTVAGRLGRNLGLDYQDSATLCVKVGAQLLHLAALAEIIEPFTDGSDDGRRVVLRPATNKQLVAYVEWAGKAARRLVRITPPTGVAVKLRRDMKLERPDAPPEVIEAADKVQRTAWRINKAVLTELLKSPEYHADLENRLILAQAEELAGLERFYLPVGLDFRGRMNQRGKFITYTGGSDLARGLLEFADGETIESDSPDYDTLIGWIEYHAAQMAGIFTPQNFSDWYTFGLKGGPKLIRDGVIKPKEPAQYLAAQFAYEDAMKGRPVHLPIRLDATCSGLQHCVWLTRDQTLAQLVNLWGDAYTAAEKMKSTRSESEKLDFYDAVATAASEAEKVTRKEAKAVLVPTFYGATLATCAEALAALRGKKRVVVTDRDHEIAAKVRSKARQLAGTAFDLLDDLERVPIWNPGVLEWETPTGFRVVQDYRENRVKLQTPRVVIDGERIGFALYRAGLRFDRERQRRGLAANFIHSHDAALLAKLVIAAPAESWAVAHDCFAVLPGQVAALLECLPGVVQDMYGGPGRDPLERQWRAWFPAPGNRGDLPAKMTGGDILA